MKPGAPTICPSCAGQMRAHPTAAVLLCPSCGAWADTEGREIPPPRPEDVKVPQEVREILRKLEGEE